MLVTKNGNNLDHIDSNNNKQNHTKNLYNLLLQTFLNYAEKIQYF